ncbi:VanZ family protein [Microbacterium stercoris]|uniref:VanZ family protein n=1 Tax=Microbacterium stercoris TaxID=2820289 RepID=A0A939QMQ6_9MICO|nr:VanZ family protein [Microbacterium stercoris]MBO3663535.1 VanZ family protein [Microbacterium stercoris]
MDDAPARRITAAHAARILLVPYSVAVALIVWLPAEDAGRVTGILADCARLLVPLGVPVEVGYPLLEFVANIALFVPLGLLVQLAWPGLGWWRIALLGLTTSALIEGVQFAIPSRFPTVSDLIANTSGSVVGWVIAHAWARR